MFVKLLFMLCMLKVSYQDLRYGYVSDRYWVLMSILVLINDYSLKTFLYCLVLFLLLHASFHKFEKFIGGADIKYLLIILYLGIPMLIYTVNIASFTALFYVLVFRTYKVRFIPFISLGLIFAILC